MKWLARAFMIACIAIGLCIGAGAGAFISTLDTTHAVVAGVALAGVLLILRFRAARRLCRSLRVRRALLEDEIDRSALVDQSLNSDLPGHAILIRWARSRDELLRKALADLPT